MAPSNGTTDTTSAHTTPRVRPVGSEMTDHNAIGHITSQVVTRPAPNRNTTMSMPSPVDKPTQVVGVVDRAIGQASLCERPNSHSYLNDTGPTQRLTLFFPYDL